MKGHVFVLAGDLNTLHCDAVLVPTDASMNMSGAFDELVDPTEVRRLEWPEGVRVLRFGEAHGPQIWLADIGLWRGADPSSYMDVVDEYARRAMEAVAPRPDDPPPLLALPVIGTGEGGFDEDKGVVYELLLPAMARAASEHGVDLALVCRGRRAYAAAQRTRRLGSSSEPAAGLTTWDFGDRTERLRARALEIADHAAVENLVLFLGAGVSAGAGLPLWQELLDRIAFNLGLDAADVARLHRLDVRDQAAILHRRTEATDASLSTSVVEQVSASRYSLTHGLLASLRNREAVTTNYDRLFEQAVAGAQQPMGVLPYEPVIRGERWLLKLHGSVDRSGSIVLTRDDYLGAPASHGALFGLVQALLITRHMLFVGYSLSDEDFHQLIHEVRRARPDAPRGEPPRDGRPRLGTALTLFDDPLFGELWADDVEVVAMAEPAAPTASEDEKRRAVAHAERRLRIFLDLVAHESADLAPFLLDPSFDSMLDPAERPIARSLRQLRETARGDHPVQRRIGRMLEALDGDHPLEELRWSADLVAAVRSACPPGAEIRTLGKDRPNWIVDADSNGIHVHTERSKAKGEPQLVPGWMLQRAYDHLAQFGALSAEYLVASSGLNVKRSSFVCAVLAELPGIGGEQGSDRAGCRGVVVTLALLCPVPVQHLRSGVETCRRRGKVAYGSQAWQVFREVDEAVGVGTPVYFYASRDPERPSGPPLVTFLAEYVRYVESRGGRHPDGHRFRPPSVREGGEDESGYWAGFYEVTDLRELAEAIPLSRLTKRDGGRFASDFWPEGPIMVGA